MATPGVIKRFVQGLWQQEGSYVTTIPTYSLLPPSPDDDGVFAFVVSSGRLYVSASGVWRPYGTPPGTIADFAGPTANIPAGYLNCDGASYLRTDYPDLFAAISTTYGAADGTHFNVPNMKGRSTIGYDSAQTEFNAIGKTGGEKVHAQTLAEIGVHTHADTLAAPAHTHVDTFAAPAHTHNVAHTHVAASGSDFVETTGSGNAGLQVAAGGLHHPNTGAASITNSGGASSTTLTGAVGAASATALTGSVSNAGSGTAFNVLDPYLTTLKIIRT